MTRTSPPTTRLVYARSTGAAGRATCADLLLPSAPEDQNVLLVSLTATPDDKLAFWREHVSSVDPHRLDVLCVGDRTRAPAGSGTDAVENGHVSIEVVDDPGNLTQLGVVITNTIADWEDDPEQTVVCFDSVTTMLQYVEVEQAFQFFNRLVRTLRSAGAIAHFHVDPGAHDETVLNTLQLLFDDVVRPRTDTDGPAASQGDPEPTDRSVPGDDRADAFHTDIEPGEPPSRAVVRAIAAVEGVAPGDLDSPLFSWVDPDAIDALLSHGGHSPVGDVRVQFTYERYRVSVADGTVEIAYR